MVGSLSSPQFNSFEEVLKSVPDIKSSRFSHYENKALGRRLTKLYKDSKENNRLLIQPNLTGKNIVIRDPNAKKGSTFYQSLWDRFTIWFTKKIVIDIPDWEKKQLAVCQENTLDGSNRPKEDSDTAQPQGEGGTPIAEDVNKPWQSKRKGKRTDKKKPLKDPPKLVLEAVSGGYVSEMKGGQQVVRETRQEEPSLSSKGTSKATQPPPLPLSPLEFNQQQKKSSL